MISDVQVSNVTVFFPFCFRTYMRKKNVNFSCWTCDKVAHARQQDSTSCGVIIQSKIMYHLKHFKCVNWVTLTVTCALRKLGYC